MSRTRRRICKARSEDAASLPLLKADKVILSADQIASRLPALKPPSSRRPRRRRVLIAGHRLHFLQPFIAWLEQRPDVELRIDHWAGHRRHDERESAALGRWADTIFCEWCLGAAVWHARAKRPSQTLAIRLHHQEMELGFRHELDWSAVDAFIAISPQNHARLQAEHAAHRDKIRFVPNLINVDRFARDKHPEARFHLGLMGMTPQRKRLDLAIDILEEVLKRDERFRLFVAGKPPQEYDWMTEREEELAYYDEIFARLTGNALGAAVRFDGHAEAPHEWLAKVGFILSTSDHEGSHQSVAEGMAAGSIPIIRSWSGADQLYPAEHVYDSQDDAVGMILRDNLVWESDETRRTAVRDYARQAFDVSVVAPKLAGAIGLSV